MTKQLYKLMRDMEVFEKSKDGDLLISCVEKGGLYEIVLENDDMTKLKDETGKELTISSSDLDYFFERVLKDGMFGYSNDGETYYGFYKTKDEAIKKAVEEYNVSSFYIGVFFGITPDVKSCFNLESLFENIDEKQGEGFYCDIHMGGFWRLLSDEQRTELENGVCEYISKYCMRNGVVLYGVQDSEEIELCQKCGEIVNDDFDLCEKCKEETE